MVSQIGTNTQANVDFAPGQPPVITANGTVDVTTGSAPALAAITNRTLIAGQTLMITNVATDADVPPQTLTFSLVTNPTGATINADSGILTWRPAIAQSPSTNAFSVMVVDNGTPGLSATQNFSVTVNQPVNPILNFAGLSNDRFNFIIGGDSGPDYLIQASTNLTNWLPVETNLSPVTPFSFTDPDTTNFPQRFYRVRLGP